MGAVPKRRISTYRGGKRVASKKAKIRGFVKCTKCGEIILPHRACTNCGYYKGHDVLKLTESRSKKKKKNEKPQRS